MSHQTILQNIVLALILLISYACTQKQPIHKLSKHEKTNYLLDSILQENMKLTFEKDTSWGKVELFDAVPAYVSIYNFPTKDKQLAFVAISLNDTSGYEVFIFKVQKTSWQYLNNPPFTLWHNHNLSDIRLQDVDFDNKRDLVIGAMCLSSRILSQYDCFDFNEKTWEIGRHKINELATSRKYEENGFDVDSLKKTITCFTDGGVMGTDEVLTYHWNCDTLQLVKQLDMVFEMKLDSLFVYKAKDFQDSKEFDTSDIKDGDTIGYVIRFNEYQLKNGKMELVKEENHWQEYQLNYFREKKYKQ